MPKKLNSGAANVTAHKKTLPDVDVTPQACEKPESLDGAKRDERFKQPPTKSGGRRTHDTGNGHKRARALTPLGEHTILIPTACESYRERARVTERYRESALCVTTHAMWYSSPFPLRNRRRRCDRLVSLPDLHQHPPREHVTRVKRETYRRGIGRSAP